MVYYHILLPEVLNGKPYTSSSDIYSFGIIMAELSFGKPPFYNRKYDLNLASDIFIKEVKLKLHLKEADKEVRTTFEEADREIPNIPTSMWRKF
ncbi:unnamed protein product [Rhizophagus irregularis]|nr:unnamed protein product [Rhizophagus irregularis]